MCLRRLLETLEKAALTIDYPACSVVPELQAGSVHGLHRLALQSGNCLSVTGPKECKVAYREEKNSLV